MPPPIIAASMSEAIQKLQPDRTIHLRGFDRRGSAAALHHASPGGFQVTGVFRDQADFAVVMLWDADDFFEHYSMKYLPDFDFTGMVLTFDLHYEGLQPIDSPKYNWIDWATLDCIDTAGGPRYARLFDHAMLAGGTFTPATGVFHIHSGAEGVQPWDRLTLWLQNIAFDYIVPGDASGVTAATVAAELARQINQYEWAGAGLVNSIMASAGSDATLTVTAARAGTVDVNGAVVTWVSGTRFPGLQAGDMMWIAGTAYAIASVDSPIQVTLTASAGMQTDAGYLAPRGGSDGNMITVLVSSKTATLTTTEPFVKLAGGSSDATWRVSVDFTGLGIDQLRQAWLTFAPALTDSGAFVDAEWSAVFTNWSVADPQGRRALKVAGPGSVRIGSADSAAKYAADSDDGWLIQAGFFHRGFCRVAQAAGSAVTVKYSCQQTHDVYVGTSLYKDRGTVSVSLDGDATTPLDCYLNCEPAIQTRRKARSGVEAGNHTVTITLGGQNVNSTGTFFYFDFLEAVVAGDAQASAQTYGAVAPAIDYDTDHGYKLSPQRLLWNLWTLGFRGSIDEYIGVFWWNQRKRVLAEGQQAFHSWTVTFGGTWADQDSVFVAIGDPVTGTMGKTVFPADTSETIARHFAAFVNETYVGVWAAADGPVLTATTRTPIWGFAFEAHCVSAGGTVATSGDLAAGDEGQWFIDDAVTPPVNRAAADWHADLFAEAATHGFEVVSAISMELVNPPAGFAQCFHDGTPVLTDTGFQSLKSTQCSFLPAVEAYQAAVCQQLVALQSVAGLQPWIQFGEFLWWFFDWYATASGKQHAGMAFYDAYTTAQAAVALGRPLAHFDTINDDPSVNGGADADFLRGRIKAHIDGLRAAAPGAKFELLYPNDVTYPVTNAFGIGGRLNHYVNFPAEFEAKDGSGLDRLKMEALSFTSQERNFDKQKASITFPMTAPNRWPRDSVAWLIAWFNGGCPWTREYQFATNAVALVNFWAFDHLALLSWPLPLPTGTARAWLL